MSASRDKTKRPDKGARAEAGSSKGDDSKREGRASAGGKGRAMQGKTGRAAAPKAATGPGIDASEFDQDEEDFDRSAWADDIGEDALDDEPEEDLLADFFVGPEELQAMRAVGLGVSVRDPNVRQRETSSLDDDYLSFILADEEYAVPITALKEIVRPLPITRVPRTPSYVLGVVTLRGTVLPVLDLRIRLGLPVGDADRSARILVVETEDGPAGIWADSVSEVVRIGNEPLEAPPGALGGGGDYLQGIIRRDGRMLIVLNLVASLRVDLQSDGK